MIPKRIHYCWFGGNQLPPKSQKCIESWRKFCPSFEIIEWNESNFDVRQNIYTAEMYQQKKYAFLSDYARLQIIYEQGGIYMDTDVELVRPLNELLREKAYFGYETMEYINTGLGFGAEPRSPVVKAMLEEYNYYSSGVEAIICTKLNTQALQKMGLTPNGRRTNIGEAAIYPIEYFNPYDDPTGRLNITKNTYSIHWYAKSWMSRKKVFRSILTKPLHRILGTDFFRKFKG